MGTITKTLTNNMKQFIDADTGMSVINIDFLRLQANNLTLNHTTRQMARKKLTILERDGFACVRCKSEDNLTIDRQFNYDRISSNHASHYKLKDCVTLCATCHIKKTKTEG